MCMKCCSICNFTMDSNNNYSFNNADCYNGCMFFFTAPKPDVSLISTPVCVDSDSNVSLTCTATLPLSHKLEFAKVFKWTMNGNITSSASDPTDPKGVVSVSTLNHRMTTSGVFVFECEVSINVTGDPVVTNSSTLTINVQGEE